jgi:NAD(P)-dependent dehydrogenase (short-subunit alcohol dehydrogenase family)
MSQLADRRKSQREADPLDLDGLTVLITGGVGDIGLTVVRRLTEFGAVVAVNDVVGGTIGPDRLAQTAPEGASYFDGDVSDPGSVERLFASVETAVGLPDVVCCHAGVVDAHPIASYPVSDFDRLMAVNVRSAFLVASAAARRWRDSQRGGSLIFTSSWVQSVPWPEITPYAASKAALHALARGFARELAPFGIRANVIAPGIVGVGMARRQWDSDPGYRRRAERAIPIGFLQPPETVADAFLFMCSPLSAYMTGSTLLVDGGCSLYPLD